MIFLKFSPIIVMVAALLSGIDVKVAACYATIYGIIIAMLVEKREFKEVTNIVYEGVATIIEVFFLY